MRRYYFDVWDGDQLFDDGIGQELGTPQTAREIAIAMLPGLCAPLAPGRKWQEITVNVRDEDGTQVLTTRLAVQVEWTINQNDRPATAAGCQATPDTACHCEN